MNTTRTLRRLSNVLKISLRHLLAHAIGEGLKRWPAVKLPRPSLPGPERLRVAIEEIGGSFIKFGQMLAMQSDILPLEYCRVLFTLFDQVQSFAYEEVERTFVEDLNRKPLEVFSYFDPKPVATGSIGQVHVAMLGTTKVAVKIRRPTILSDLAADIASLKLVLRIVKLLRIKWLYWMIAPTEEFIAWTQDEVDFRREAHYMDELSRNARGNPFERVPTVFWTCTTARILTAEFLDGLTLSEYFRSRDAGSLHLDPRFNANLFAARLIDNFLGDAFRHGMFHADLHPGNLMILKNNVVGYIDFGISGVLSAYSRRHLISMTLAYARGELDAMCESFFRISTFDRNADIQGFRQGLVALSAGWYGTAPGQSRLRKSITSIMLDLLILSKSNGIWPQRDVIKYIRSAIALDGLIKTFSPNVDVGRHLEEACERHIKRDSFKALISYGVATGWLGGLTRLAGDGLLRVFALLDQSDRDAMLSPAPSGNQQVPAWLHGFLQLIWVGFCLAMPFLLGQRNYRAYRAHPVSAFVALSMPFMMWRILEHARGKTRTART